MRKRILRGILGAMCCLVVFSLVATYAVRHPDSALAQRLGKIVNSGAYANVGDLDTQQEVCAPDEPHPLDALLPDPAKLTADWQPFETINVLNNSNKQPPELIPDVPSPEVFSYPSVIRSPGAKARERLPVMPRPDTAVDSEADRSAAEEQEQPHADQKADPRAIEERLRHILQSYLRKRNWPTQAGVDTMEFRPSDAKKGEFDPISF